MVNCQWLMANESEWARGTLGLLADMAQERGHRPGPGTRPLQSLVGEQARGHLRGQDGSQLGQGALHQVGGGVWVQ